MKLNFKYLLGILLTGLFIIISMIITDKFSNISSIKQIDKYHQKKSNNGIIQYNLKGDVLECNVTSEINQDTTIRFCVWDNKITYKVTEDLKYNDSKTLTRIYKQFNLDSTEIKKTMNELINKKKAEQLKKESTQQQKTFKQATPAPSKKQTTTRTAAPSEKSKSTSTETKSADVLD